MKPNIYSEIRTDLQPVADFLEDSEIEYRVYNHGIQFNARSSSGIWHSFYPTTGTILLNAGNEKTNRQHISLRGKTKEDFLYYLMFPDAVRLLFKERRFGNEHNER